MDRRTLIKAIPLGLASIVGGRVVWREIKERRSFLDALSGREPWGRLASPELLDPPRDEGAIHPGDGSGSDPLDKTANFDRTYGDDVFVADDQREILLSVGARLQRAQRLVGHGNFNLLGFDDLLKFAQNYPAIGAFTRAELDFLEALYYRDAADYGFLGDKVLTNLTDRIKKKDVEKIAGSGHYLLRGEPLEKFRKIQRDIGDSITLTSGVRAMAKQFQLFAAKAVEVDGNYSQASRSLAPPGYSYHARGDFDLGKKGMGLLNFTESFCETDEYRRMIDLGYVKIRYTEANPFGVRHEPWHVKIA